MHRKSGWAVLSSLVVAAAAIGFAPSAARAEEETYFSFISTPGSWVGHGYLNYAVSPATNWSFSATAWPDQRYVRLSTRSLDPNAPTSNYYWDLDLEAPNNGVLVPGHYPGAARYPFNAVSDPGMWLSGNHRGDNIITGYFTVWQAEFGSGGTVNRFAVDFRQYDEGNPNNWVDGQWRFNATVPEPAAAGVIGICGLLAMRRRVRLLSPA